MIEKRLNSASYIIHYFIFYYIGTVFSPSLIFFIMIESMLQLVHVAYSSVTVYIRSVDIYGRVLMSNEVKAVLFNEVKAVLFKIH